MAAHIRITPRFWPSTASKPAARPPPRLLPARPLPRPPPQPRARNKPPAASRAGQAAFPRSTAPEYYDVLARQHVDCFDPDQLLRAHFLLELSFGHFVQRLDR